MTTQAQPGCTPALQDPIHVQPRVLRLPNGAALTISNNVPATPAARVLQSRGAQFYGYFGWVRTGESPLLGGYFGESGSLSGLRPAESFRHWHRTQQHLAAFAAVHVRSDQPFDHDDYRRLVEAHVIRALSYAELYMLNTQSSCPESARRLVRADVLRGLDVAGSISQAVLAHVFQGRTNDHPAPAGNNRELAVRVLRHADRAMNTGEVVRAMRAAGAVLTGQTIGFTVRRDLIQRERESRGRPRAYVTWHAGRRLFYPPHLPRNEAVRRYVAAQRRGRR
jgi:hypothetical protein